MENRKESEKRKWKNLHFLKVSIIDRKNPDNNNKIVITIQRHYLP